MTQFFLLFDFEFEKIKLVLPCFAFVLDVDVVLLCNVFEKFVSIVWFLRDDSDKGASDL